MQTNINQQYYTKIVKIRQIRVSKRDCFRGNRAKPPLSALVIGAKMNRQSVKV